MLILAERLVAPLRNLIGQFHWPPDSTSYLHWSLFNTHHRGQEERNFVSPMTAGSGSPCSRWRVRSKMNSQVVWSFNGFSLCDSKETPCRTDILGRITSDLEGVERTNPDWWLARKNTRISLSRRSWRVTIQLKTIMALVWLWPHRTSFLLPYPVP